MGNFDRWSIFGKKQTNLTEKQRNFIKSCSKTKNIGILNLTYGKPNVKTNGNNKLKSWEQAEKPTINFWSR